MYSRSGLKATMPKSQMDQNHLSTGKGGGFGKRPKSLVCYICGREYGTASLKIHLKTCEKKFLQEQQYKPKKQQRPLPNPPPSLIPYLDGAAAKGISTQQLQQYNEEAFDSYNYQALEPCLYCGRTFKPESLVIHQKSCTADRPMQSLVKRGGGNGGNNRAMGGGGGYSAQDEQGPVNQNLVSCRKCGRNFASDRIQKHQNVCKGGKTKLKTKHLRELEEKERQRKMYDKYHKKPRNNWRQKHLELQQGMKYNRKVTGMEQRGEDLRSLEPPPSYGAIESGYIKCPHCTRSFNEQAAERHIPRCKSIINKPKPAGTLIRKLPVSKQTNFGSPQKSANKQSSYGRQSYQQQQQQRQNPSNYMENDYMDQYNSSKYKQQQQQSYKNTSSTLKNNARQSLNSYNNSANQRASSMNYQQKKTQPKQQQSRYGQNQGYGRQVGGGYGGGGTGAGGLDDFSSINNPNKSIKIGNSNQSSMPFGGNIYQTSNNSYGNHHNRQPSAGNYNSRRFY